MLFSIYLLKQGETLLKYLLFLLGHVPAILSYYENISVYQYVFLDECLDDRF